MPTPKNPEPPTPYPSPKSEAPAEPLKSARRPPPPVVVPQAIRYGGGMATQRARDLNVMLNDLGLLRGPVTSHYTNSTRNGVSLLQQRLTADGFYSGRPDGSFDTDTRAALLADPDIPTTT